MAIKPAILASWGPGGWQFYQPETDWHAPGPLENSFDKQVKNIIAMRKLNPRFNLATDEASVAADLERYTEARWAKIYSKRGMEKFLAQDPAALAEQLKKKESNTTPGGRSLPAAVAALAEIDTRALEEWLGAGGIAVPKVLAEQRAAICVECPANKSGWRSVLTVPASKLVHGYLTLKNRMRLATSLDVKLESCTACKCVLTLKVWCPIGHIRDNTTPETMKAHREANEKCWVLTEP